MLKVAGPAKAFEHELTRALFRIKSASQSHCIWPAPSPRILSRLTPAQTSALMPHPPPAPRQHRRPGHWPPPPPAPGAASAAAAGQSGPRYSALVHRRPARPHGARVCAWKLGSAGLRRGTCIAYTFSPVLCTLTTAASLLFVVSSTRSHQASKPLKCYKVTFMWLHARNWGTLQDLASMCCP